MKRYGPGVIAFVVLLCISNNLFAQAYIKGREMKKAVANFTELANYYKAHPQPKVRHLPFDEGDDEERKPNHAAPPSMVHMFHKPHGNAAMGPSYGPMLPVSPAPVDTFLASPSPVTDIPPDTHGAVDSQYCVTAINTDIRVQTRVGGAVSDIVLDGFWSAVLPSGTVPFDPRVFYDVNYKRWIVTTDAVTQPSFTNSTIMVAVSVTNDPTGDWNMYAVAVDPTGASWLDFPNVGYNSKWIVVNGNMFPNTVAGVGGTYVYIFDYASMMAGIGAPYTLIPRDSSFSICPAQTYDPTEPNMYALESWSGTHGQLRLWEISGPVGSPVMNTVGYPATAQHWHGSAPGGGGDFAPQLGTAHLVDAGDDRFTSLIYRNHKLWCSHTVFLPDPGTTNRSAVQWWQMDTLANPLQIGLINDPTGAVFYDYSSIAVNDSDDALLGFGYLSNSVYPSGAYALHMHTDPLDSTRPADVFRHGQATYYTTFGGSKNRWGDYSQAVIDPRNNMDFWTIQESSNNADTIANWDTWWANVQFCPKPHAPTLSYSGMPCIGDTGVFTIVPIPGATSYEWYVTGGGWAGPAGSTDTTSITATAGTGTTTVVVLAYNSCGEGESNTFNVTPATVPSAPSISVYTPPCTGAATAVFIASGASAFNWSVVGTGWSGSSTSSTFSTTVGTGTADIICYATNACGNGPSDTFMIAPGTPVASFSESTYSTVTSANDTVNFTGTAPTGSTYSWDFDGGIATPGTGPGPQYVYWTTGGTKTVTLTVNNNGCTSSFSDTVQIMSLVAVPQVNNPSINLSIIPNPNEGSFSIVFNKPVNKTVTVKMADMDGRIVYNNDFGYTGSNKIPVVTNDLPAGTYAVTIYAGSNVVTQKITIAK